MVFFLILANGTIIYDAYSTPVRKAMRMLSRFLGVACSPTLSVSLEGMGCKPVLNLEATPDEDVSIICTIVDKTIPSTFGRS
jgi:hypothetical protein